MHRLAAIAFLLLGCGSKDAPPAPKATVPIDAVDPVAHGQAVFLDKGCTSCHSVDGTEKTGPTLKGIFGTTVALIDGSSVTVDDAYFRESVRDPLAKRVAGFMGVQPTFSVAHLSEADLNDIIAYVKAAK